MTDGERWPYVVAVVTAAGSLVDERHGELARPGELVCVDADRWNDLVIKLAMLRAILHPIETT